MSEDTKRGLRGPWQKGQSGNPSGRPKIAKALMDATGKTTSEATADLLKKLFDVLEDLNPGDKDESASWRYAHQTLMYYIVGKPKEQVVVENRGGATYDASKLTLEQLRAVCAIEPVETSDDDSAPTEH